MSSTDAKPACDIYDSLDNIALNIVSLLLPETELRTPDDFLELYEHLIEYLMNKIQEELNYDEEDDTVESDCDIE